MKETELKIRIYGDKALRKKAEPVKSIGAEDKALIDKMAKIMYSNGGIGLAAPQLGVNKQLVIIDVGQGLFKLFNPKIKKKKGSDVLEEGCLSVPGISIKVKRAKKVLFEGTNESNEYISFWADDLFCRALQHEIDHLKGKLIVDYANILKKMEIKKKFRKK
ncbi:peptide deformylase [Candidatus Omnitrophota bacterium]